MQLDNITKVVYDVDECLAEFTKDVLLYINFRYNTNYCKDDMHTYWIEDNTNLSHEEMKEIITDFRNLGGLCNLECIPFNQKAMNVLNDIYKNKYVMIVTSRGIWSGTDTLRWLSQYNIQYNEYHQGVKHKELYADDHTIVVEDCPEYINRIVASKGKVLVYDQPWNRDIEESEFTHRVYNWHEIGSLLL